MSKKVLIILLSSVLSVGIIATAITAVYFSPVNSAKRAFENFDKADKIKVTLTQTYYGETVNKKISFYEKSDGGYSVTVTEQKLSENPLSKDVYETFNYTFAAKSPPVYFKFRNRYFTDKSQKSASAKVFSAAVKQKYLSDFFINPVSDCKEVFINLCFTGKVIYFYDINYKIGDDDFTLKVEFLY